jgi:hypothetical protein
MKNLQAGGNAEIGRNRRTVQTLCHWREKKTSTIKLNKAAKRMIRSPLALARHIRTRPDDIARSLADPRWPGDASTAPRQDRCGVRRPQGVPADLGSVEIAVNTTGR